MYIGYNKSAKIAELRHIEALCQSRLQPLRVMSCSGLGAGMPVLRMMCITTVRSMIDYAAPCLSVLGMERINKIELLQNKAMSIIFGCQRNAMIDAMRLELNVPSVCDNTGTLG